MRLIPFSAALFLTLAACDLPPPFPAPDPGPVGTCGADGLQGLVGQHVSVLGGMSFPGPVRVIRPGDAVTMDYNPDRINIEVSDAQRILRIFCG